MIFFTDSKTILIFLPSISHEGYLQNVLTVPFSEKNRSDIHSVPKYFAQTGATVLLLSTENTRKNHLQYFNEHYSERKHDN